jgi:tetratricopeptide (TPR) repeat protein
MGALLEALRPPRMSAAARVALLVGIGGVAGAGIMSSAETPAPAPGSYCDDVEDRLAGVWDDAGRATLASAYAEAPVRYGGAAMAKRVSTELDRYAAAWTTAQRDACTDGAEGRSPEAVVNARMSCLARRRATFAAFSGSLLDGEAETLSRASEAVHNLPSLAPCADAGALGRGVAPPPDPERAAVDEVRATLDAAVADSILGRVQPGLARAREAESRARDLSYLPVRAEAELRLGAMLSEAGEFDDAEAMLSQALSRGVASHHDAVVAESAQELAHLEHARLSTPEAIERWVALGLAGLDALGGARPHLRAGLLTSRASAKRRAGDLDGAITDARTVLKIRETHWGPQHYSVAEPLTALGKAYAARGQFDDSVEAIERARVVLRATYGDAHPTYGMVLQNLGSTHLAYGQYARAHGLWTESRDVLLAALGAEHPAIGVLTSNLAVTLTYTERFDEALAHAQRALEIESSAQGANSAAAAGAWALIGEIHLRAGRTRDALTAFERAIEIAVASTPDQPARIANYRSQLGLAQLESGAPERAANTLEPVLSVVRSTAGEPSVEVAETAGRLAMARLKLGQANEARALIDVSVEQYESADPDPHQHAEARFRRAQILASTGDWVAARHDAKTALDIYTRLADQPSRRDAVQGWLASARSEAP